MLPEGAASTPVCGVRQGPGRRLRLVAAGSTGLVGGAATEARADVPASILGAKCYAIEQKGRPPNKAMKLTRLAAAPGRMRQGAAAWPRGRGTGATASQLIAGVRWTHMGRAREDAAWRMRRRMEWRLRWGVELKRRGRFGGKTA